MNAGDPATKSIGAAGIVMAAGQGTRFASDVPKVMHRVAGRPAGAQDLAGLAVDDDGCVARLGGPGGEDLGH